MNKTLLISTYIVGIYLSIMYLFKPSIYDSFRTERTVGLILVLYVIIVRIYLYTLKQ